MTTVLAHGCFDLLHPGHVAHLEAASALGDRLVVSITADAFVRKGPDRPVFSQRDRAAQLSALRCVDAVRITEEETAVAAILDIRPAIYVKGTDWQERGIIADEAEACQRVGATVRYLGAHTHSSSALINHALRPLGRDLRHFLRTVNGRDVTGALNAMAGLRVAVVGDAITDVYHTVRVQGLTAKASVPSFRHLRTERMDGGSVAIERHANEFASRVVRPYVGEPVVKERYVSEPSGDQPLTKYFAVATPPTPAPEDAYERVRSALHECDVCLVGDFGHGAMTDRLRKLVQDEAPFLAVNCQTNSSNYGFNILPQRYWRCDLFTLDRTELALAAGTPRPDAGPTLRSLREQLHAAYGFLTRGDHDTIADMHLGSLSARVTCPAIEGQPVDTLGAGDAFFAVVSLAIAAKVPLDLALLLGQVAGAQATKIVGNRSAVSRSEVRDHAIQLLAQ